jgi:hypothetical protein
MCSLMSRRLQISRTRLLLAAQAAGPASSTLRAGPSRSHRNRCAPFTRSHPGRPAPRRPGMPDRNPRAPQPAMGRTGDLARSGPPPGPRCRHRATARSGISSCRSRRRLSACRQAGRFRCHGAGPGDLPDGHAHGCAVHDPHRPCRAAHQYQPANRRHRAIRPRCLRGCLAVVTAAAWTRTARPSPPSRRWLSLAREPGGLPRQRPALTPIKPGYCFMAVR